MRMVDNDAIDLDQVNLCKLWSRRRWIPVSSKAWSAEENWPGCVEALFTCIAIEQLLQVVVQAVTAASSLLDLFSE